MKRMASDPFASTPGAHVRHDNNDLSWRIPADREEARRLVAEHRRGEIDVWALPGDETSHLARELWTQELQAAQRWARTAWWQSSRAGFPPLPSPAPPESLSEWSYSLRQQHGVGVRYDEYVRNRAEAHRLTAAQNDAYARRSA
jgi:hypothetical protein